MLRDTGLEHLFRMLEVIRVVLANRQLVHAFDFEAHEPGRGIAWIHTPPQSSLSLQARAAIAPVFVHYLLQLFRCDLGLELEEAKVGKSGGVGLEPKGIQFFQSSAPLRQA